MNILKFLENKITEKNHIAKNKETELNGVKIDVDLALLNYDIQKKYLDKVSQELTDLGHILSITKNEDQAPKGELARMIAGHYNSIFFHREDCAWGASPSLYVNQSCLSKLKEIKTKISEAEENLNNAKTELHIRETIKIDLKESLIRTEREFEVIIKSKDTLEEALNQAKEQIEITSCSANTRECAGVDSCNETSVQEI